MVGIIITGGAAVAAALKSKDLSIKLLLPGAIKEAAFFIEGEVKQSIAGHRAETRSVDTGRFLSSVRANIKSAYEAEVLTEVEYAKYLEYGTSKVLPRPHFRNTAARNEKKVQGFIEAAVK